MMQTNMSTVTVRRVNSPTNITVDFSYATRENIKYAYLDEKYLIIVTLPPLGRPRENYEIQVRSTLDYHVIKSQIYPPDGEDVSIAYRQGLIVKCTGRTLRY